MGIAVSIHARVERATLGLTLDEVAIQVSIHARVERATLYYPYRTIHGIVSIHARVERATARLGLFMYSLVFQSTHA